LNSRLR
jgi:hypothetical protein